MAIGSSRGKSPARGIYNCLPGANCIGFPDSFVPDLSQELVT
jgi:hypothetical protein